MTQEVELTIESPPGGQQIEMFLGELVGPATKNYRESMTVPWFSVLKGGDKKTRVYEDDRNGLRVEIIPSVGGSTATVWDQDILFYLATLLVKAVDEGKEVSDKLIVNPRNMLRHIGRGTGGKDYVELVQALKRLKQTTITMNQALGKGKKRYKSISLINDFDYQGREDDSQIGMLHIQVSDWFFQAMLGKEVLTIDPGYFKLKSGIARRLYLISRRRCGKQTEWSIDLERLQSQCGSTKPLKRFRHDLRKEIKAGGGFWRLPGYFLALDESDNVRVFGDHELGKKALAAFMSARYKAALPRPREDLED